MEVTAYWEGGFRCRVPVRQFELRSDEPPQDGGTDTGPMPTELLLTSLAACFAMAVAYVARKQGIQLPDLNVRVRGEHTGARFQRIAVEIRSSASRSEVESLIERAKAYCYVSNTLSQSPELDYAVVEETTHSPSSPPA